MKLLSANWFAHSSVNQCLNLSKPKGYYDHILIIHQKFVDFVEVLRVSYIKLKENYQLMLNYQKDAMDYLMQKL